MIPKFLKIVRGSRLISERLAKMIVGDELISRQKEVLTEMLYNREAALAWDFSEINKIIPEITSPQQIRTIPHIF